MTGREQRLVFGEDPELYDRARPAYPDAVIDAVVALAGPSGRSARRALEVGAGTGKATVGVAARGLAVTAVEPDPGMATVLRRNVAGLDRVRVAETGFEDFDPGPVAHDLVYCAQAWHWVDPAVRYLRAAAALRPGGGLALFWHCTCWPQGDPLRAELDDLYRRHAPGLAAREPGFPGNGGGGRERGGADLGPEARASGWFTDTTRLVVEWPASYDAEGYVALLCTQSDHAMAGPAALAPLLDAIRDLVERRGGRIEVPYATVLFSARRTGG